MDGTKIEANASLQATRTEASLRRLATDYAETVERADAAEEGRVEHVRKYEDTVQAGVRIQGCALAVMELAATTRARRQQTNDASATKVKNESWSGVPKAKKLGAESRVMLTRR